MKLKTSDLKGAALDWAVAECEGNGWSKMVLRRPVSYMFRPSTDWSQGGPIIERERIDLETCGGGWRSVSEITFQSDTPGYYGPTPLIAAMRCYVASTLGEAVDVPDDIALDSMIYNTCDE